MTSTRKVVITEFGDVDVLKIVQDSCPPPPAGHIQIETEFSGFSGADINMRKGIYPLMKKAPLTPGYCLVGTVRALGKDCTTRLQPGDVVAVLTKYDAEADLVNQPEKYCIPVPEGVDHGQATALLCDWATAYGMVMQSAKVAKGDKVFVHGISGAVGYAVMKLSQLQGARVFGTASQRNHGLIEREGATVFSYTDKAWIAKMTELGGADAVFDPLGYESLDESYSILSPRGKLVAYGNNKNSLEGGQHRSPVVPLLKMFARGLNPLHSKQTTFFGLSRDSSAYMSNVSKLLELLKDGGITVPIKNTWNLEDIKTAHGEWGRANGVGSMLIRVRAEAHT